MCTTYPSALIGPVTFGAQGVWQASFTATLTEACAIGTPIGPPGYQANMHVGAGPASGSESTISTNQSDVPADGIRTAKITVQAKDVFGNVRQGRTRSSC